MGGWADERTNRLEVAPGRTVRDVGWIVGSDSGPLECHNNDDGERMKIDIGPFPHL